MLQLWDTIADGEGIQSELAWWCNNTFAIQDPDGTRDWTTQTTKRVQYVYVVVVGLGNTCGKGGGSADFKRRIC